MISEEGQRLFERIARTPADEEGNIDPLQLHHELEDEEDWEIPEEENSTATQNDILINGAAQSKQKLSQFLHSLLEESSFILSNEPLTEAVIADCLRKLGQYRAEQARRELIMRLQTEETLSDEERTTYRRQLHQKAQELRGLPPDPLVG
jgi:hypothetical protein